MSILVTPLLNRIEDASSAQPYKLGRTVAPCHSSGGAL